MRRLVVAELFFSGLWLPVVDPRLVGIQLVDDLVDFTEMRLVLGPDQVALALDVLVEVFVVVKADLAVVVVRLRLWNRNHTAFLSLDSLTLGTVADLLDSELFGR